MVNPCKKCIVQVMCKIECKDFANYATDTLSSFGYIVLNSSNLARMIRLQVRDMGTSCKQISNLTLQNLVHWGVTPSPEYCIMVDRNGSIHRGKMLTKYKRN